jgi:hypothetical protein
MAKARSATRGSGRTDDEIELDRSLLLRTEEEWMASRLRGEAGLTESLLDEKYRGTTSDGRSQTKEEFVRAVASSPAAGTRADHTERTIQIYGDFGLSTGVVELNFPERVHAFRYLRVFRKTDGEWRLLVSQSTRLSEGRVLGT